MTAIAAVPSKLSCALCMGCAAMQPRIALTLRLRIAAARFVLVESEVCKAIIVSASLLEALGPVTCLMPIWPARYFCSLSQDILGSDKQLFGPLSGYQILSHQDACGTGERHACKIATTIRNQQHTCDMVGGCKAQS
jgi:hypothetical protein